MRGLRRLWRSVGYAWSGIVYAVSTQVNMRIHLCVAVAVLLLSWWLAIPVLHLLVILLFIALVIALELVNTAIESAIDLTSPARHPLAKAAKDTAAGAVLIAAILSVVAGLILLGPPLLRKFAEWFSFG